jgi:hypothetical protein
MIRLNSYQIRNDSHRSPRLIKALSLRSNKWISLIRFYQKLLYFKSAKMVHHRMAMIGMFKVHLQRTKIQKLDRCLQSVALIGRYTLRWQEQGRCQSDRRALADQKKAILWCQTLPKSSGRHLKRTNWSSYKTNSRECILKSKNTGTNTLILSTN